MVRQLGPRPEAAVIDWAKQVCSILEYLHQREQPIVHRDLTPDNIILCDDGNIRVIDFGAAQQFIEGVTGTLIGKQCYVAPEQLRGLATVRSDIYSLGCTIYFLLTGKDPLPLTECNPQDEVKVSAWLNELVRTCTAFDEQDRPQSIDRVIDALDGHFAPILEKPQSADSAEHTHSATIEVKTVDSQPEAAVTHE